MPLIGTRAAASTRGFGRFSGGPILYPFSSHTFTNAQADGPDGPTLAQCISAYSGTVWASNTQFFNMTTQGIQLWTVPATAVYSITLRGGDGACGATSSSGTAGRGITISLKTPLQAGEILRIVVGQRGKASTSHGGGGGATYIVRDPYNTNESIIAIAGGGGGRRSGNQGPGWDAWQFNYGSADSIQSSASRTSQVNNTTSGTGYTPSTTTLGQGGCSANNNFGDGGGGFYGNGYDDDTSGNAGGGVSFINGSTGGRDEANGGFGGGGSGAGNAGGGGGGGYTGGNGGFTAGGGGSWVISGATDVTYDVSGSQPSAEGSHGYATITIL